MEEMVQLTSGIEKGFQYESQRNVKETIESNLSLPQNRTQGDDQSRCKWGTECIGVRLESR